MRCRKIQELLKSDYFDREANQSEVRLVKGHLAHCKQCARLEQELQAQRMLMQSAKRLPVPDGIWQNIRQGIVGEGLKQESSVLGRLKNYLFAPRPVFVLAGTFAMVIFVAVFFVIQRQFSDRLDNTGSDMAIYSLNGESDNMPYSLGTDIEEYFL